MDLLLWRWSTAVQVTSIALIVVFFLVLRRTDRRAELDWWVLAWAANLVALTVTLLFWSLEPGPAMLPVVRLLYLGGKTAFVLLLIQGAWSVVRPGGRLLLAKWTIPALATYALVGAVTLSSVPLIGVRPAHGDGCAAAGWGPGGGDRRPRRRLASGRGRADARPPGVGRGCRVPDAGTHAGPCRSPHHHSSGDALLRRYGCGMADRAGVRPGRLRTRAA